MNCSLHWGRSEGASFSTPHFSDPDYKAHKKPLAIKTKGFLYILSFILAIHLLCNHQHLPFQ